MNENNFDIRFPENTAPLYVLRVIEETFGVISFGVDESRNITDYVPTSLRHSDSKNLQSIVISLIKERYGIDMSNVQDFCAISFCKILYERLTVEGRLHDFDEFLYDFKDRSQVDSWACYRVVERVFGYKPSDFGYVVNHSTLEDFIPERLRDLTLEEKRAYVLECVRTAYGIDICDVKELNIVTLTGLLKECLIKEGRLYLFKRDFDSDVE